MTVCVAGCGAASPTCRTGSITPVPLSATELSIEQSSPSVAALARQYEPTVRMTVLDRFWPVSVASVLRERAVSGAGMQLLASETVSAGTPTLADLSPSDTTAAYLSYPAPLTDKVDQMRAFLRGIGLSSAAIGAWPAGIAPVEARTAQIYFFDAGTGCAYPGADTTHDTALQYWFFYGYNYY